MKIKAQKTVTVDVDYEVDDRIYHEDEMIYKIANIIIDDRMEGLINTVYSGEDKAVSWAVIEINEAFKKADKILAL